MFDPESILSFFRRQPRVPLDPNQTGRNNDDRTGNAIEVSLHTLEERVLYSAVPLPVDLVAQTDAVDFAVEAASASLFDSAQPAFELEPLSAPENITAFDLSNQPESTDSTSLPTDGSSFSDPEGSDDGVLTEQDQPSVSTTELVVVDRGVENYQTLVNDLLASQSEGRTFEIIYLDAETSGIEQLTSKILARVESGGSPFDAMHIVSHGSDGTIQLGSDRLSSNNLAQFHDSIVAWGEILTDDADLLIYGCDLASTDDGKSFVDSIASLTGADVAASDDLTGSAELGGDWDFEYTVGVFESSIALAETTQENWSDVLAIQEVSRDSGGQAKSFGIDGADRTSIVTSINDSPNTDGFDIQLQSTDQFGTTTSIIVNETLAGDQINASIAVAENGTKVVTWTSVSTSGERSIFAKIYSGSNSVVQDEFRVDVPAVGVEVGASSVGIDAAGNSVIVWSSEQSGVSEILARRYDVAGSPVGDVFNVSGSVGEAINESDNPFVAMNDTGQFVVVWDTFNGAANDKSNVYASTFNADGSVNAATTTIHNEENFQINQATVDIDSNGNFVVGYTFKDLSEPDGDLNVRVENHDFDINHFGSHRSFVTHDSGDQFGSTVALKENGQVVIAWEGEGIAPNGQADLAEAYFAVIEFADGSSVLEQSSLSSTSNVQTLIDRSGPSAALSNDGTAAFVYMTNGTSNDTISSRFLPTGNNNESPTSSDRDRNILEDEIRVITTADFNFADTDGGSFTQVQISRVPQHGRLLLNGTEVSNGELILASAISAGDLTYEPDQDYSGEDNILFFVHDGTSYADSFSTLKFEILPEVDGFVSAFGTTYTSATGGVPVNSSTIGDQDNPTISALDDGGYVVVWESVDNNLAEDSDSDGDNDDGKQIYLQRFDAANNKVGSEVLVGGGLTGDQTLPSVVTLSDGSYIIAAVTIDNGSRDIFAQRFDLSGNVLFGDGSIDATGTATITLAEHSANSQNFVSITALRDGGFIASWSTFAPTFESATSFTAVARIFDADGNASDEFLLNEADSGIDVNSQIAPHIAELTNGSLVATWFESESNRVIYRVFNSAGEPLTPEQPVSAVAGTFEYGARVASLGDNGFVIVWRDGLTNEAGDIMARAFEVDGTPRTATSIQLGETSDSPLNVPEIVGLNDGGFIATWSAIGADADDHEIVGARYDADLNAVTDLFGINSSQYGSQANQTVTLLANGELAVSYTSADGDNGGSIFEKGIFVERMTPATVAVEDTAIPLDLNFSDIDIDGSEYVDDIQLSGMPEGTIVSDGVTSSVVTGFGHVVYVTGMGMQVENLTVTPPPEFYGDISLGVTFVVRDTDGTSIASAAYETRPMAIRVNPANDVASYDPIATTVTESGTTNVDLDSFLSPDNDVDNSGIVISVPPVTNYELDAAAPLTESGGNFVWSDNVGTAGDITFDSSNSSFNQNPTTNYQGITAALDLEESAGGALSVTGLQAFEIWFQPEDANTRQILLDLGDADSGFSLQLFNGNVELHFRSPDAPSDVTPQVLIGGPISTTEFNQVAVAFASNGNLSGNPSISDVVLYVDGNQVDVLTDLQSMGDLSLLSGTLTGSLGSSDGDFVDADPTTTNGFAGSIAGFSIFDQAISQAEVEHQFFEVAHGAHIVQIDGQDVEVGVSTALSSGALVTYNADGTLTYDPNGQFEDLTAYDPGSPGSFASDDFSITVSDGQGDTQALTVGMIVQGESEEPTLNFSIADPAPTTASLSGDLVATAVGSDANGGNDSDLTYALTGTVTGAFVIDSDSGEIRIDDESVYQNPPGGQHDVEVTVSDTSGNSSTTIYTVPIYTVPSGQISGTIYEDAVGDGSIAGDGGVDGVTVYLYRDNGDAVRDTNDTLVASTTTTGGGNYTFTAPTITYDDYFVVVDSKGITSSNGFAASADADDVWAEQTYASAGGLYLNQSGVEVVSTGGVLFGGYSGTRSDDASTLSGAEHISKVTVSNTGNGVADFGFSFNVVTNTLGGDTQDDDASTTRTVQGSLRQFIQNANAIDNSDFSDVDNAMRFIARNAADSVDSTWWSVVVSEALPNITDSHTTIDGTVYAADGSGVLDLRTNTTGTVATVGANDSHSLTGYDQPEFEIVADQSLADIDRVLDGLVFATSADQTILSDIRVRNLSIHGFGTTSGEGSNIHLAGGGISGTSEYIIENALIENVFLGVAPDGSHGTTLRSLGINIFRANDGVLQDSLIGNQGLSGIHFVTNGTDGGSSVATGWQILRNEITDNGLSDSQFDGITIGNSSGTVVRHNLIANNSGFGIDSFFAPGGFNISENTVTGNGFGGFDAGGIRLFGDDSVVSQNRIIDNFGTGISVAGTTLRRPFFAFAGTGNELTQNQFGDNSGIDIDLVSSLTNGQALSDIVVDGTPVAGLDTNGDDLLSADEIAGTGLSLAEHDVNTSGTLSEDEFNLAQASFAGAGDGDSGIDGINQHSGNQGLDEPELVEANLFSDRVELEFDIASGVERIELYDVTVVSTEERVTYVTSLLVSNMTFDSVSNTYRITVAGPPPIAGQLTAIAFDGTNNTSEFGNRTQLNTAPTAQSNNVSTPEDTSLGLSQSDFGFTDPEDQTNTSLGNVTIGSVSGGTLELNGSSLTAPEILTRTDLDNLVFVPTPNSNAAGSIQFEVTDSNGLSDGETYTLTINVTPVNDLPAAQSNTISTVEDTQKPLEQADFGFTDVEDQSDVALGEINISSVTGGTLQVSNADILVPATFSRSSLDSLAFIPTPNSTTPGSIQFQVFDSESETDGLTYSLTINIIPENDAPMLNAPAIASVNENSEIAGTPTATDAEDGNVSWLIVGGDDAAKFTNDAGTLRFIDVPDFENPQDADGDNVYRVRLAAIDEDGQQSSSQLTEITVTDQNEAPVARDDQTNMVLLESDDTLTSSTALSSMVQDSDADDVLTFSIVQQPDFGTVEILEDSNFTYTPTNESSNQSDSFQFVATDLLGLQSEVVTVNIDSTTPFVIPGTTLDRAQDDTATEDETGSRNESESNDESTENEEAENDTSTPSAVTSVDDENSGDYREANEAQLTVSAATTATNDDFFDFNGNDGAETDELTLDNSTSQLGRTYDYALNVEDSQLLRSFSQDREYRRSLGVTQFDVNVLASAFLDELDSSKHQFLQSKLAIGVPEVAASAATLLTMSYLVWNMASGILLSTFMSSLPAWSSFDILPVIASSAIASDDGESIEQIVDA